MRATRHLSILLALSLAASCKPKAEPSPRTVPADVDTGSSDAAREAAATRSPDWLEPPNRREESRLGKGRWRIYRKEEALTGEQLEIAQRLEAIGYVSGSVEAGELAGITIHDKGKTYEGLNFYTSGHGQEAILMDMEGHVLHTWSADFWQVWPGHKARKKNENTQFWRRARLLENGDVLVIYEGLGIVKLDRDSNVLWARSNKAHHDLEVASNGDIFVLTRKAGIVPPIDEEQMVLEDFLTVLSPKGKVKRSVSLIECFLNSDEHRGFMLENRAPAGDLFHTNTVHVLDGRIAEVDPAFRKGNVLTSFLVMNLIGVVDLKRREIVWTYRGDLLKQHDPRVLENGNILIFDNRKGTGRSIVMEIDPATRETRWEYAGTSETPFYTRSCGTAQRLPNGNTLITESDNGRAFEVTPDRTIVWEFINPHRAGKDGKYIATLFETVRLEPDFPLGWL